VEAKNLDSTAAGIDEPFIYVDETEPTRALFTYHADHQGSVVAMSDSTGSQVEAYSYSSYGVASIATPTTGQAFCLFPLRWLILSISHPHMERAQGCSLHRPPLR